MDEEKKQVDWRAAGLKAAATKHRRDEKLEELDTTVRGLEHKIKSLTPEPSVLVIKQNGKPDIQVDSAHKQFPLLLSLIGARENVYLFGAPGGGKSHAANQAADGPLRFPARQLTFCGCTTSWNAREEET